MQRTSKQLRMRELHFLFMKYDVTLCRTAIKARLERV